MGRACVPLPSGLGRMATALDPEAVATDCQCPAPGCLASLNGDSGKTSVEQAGFCWRGSTRETIRKVVLWAEVLYW